MEEFLGHFGFPGESDASRFFLRNAFARFFAPDLRAFLETLGVPTVEERGGRVFPVGNDAHQVAEALIRYAREQGVQFRLRSRVSHLRLIDGELRGMTLQDGADPGPRGDPGYRRRSPTPRLAPAAMATGWPRR